MNRSRRRAEILAVQFQHARGRDQSQLRLEQIGAVDGEQRLPFFDVVTDRGEQRNDAALIGRENLDRQFFIEVDTADGLFFDREAALLGRLDFYGVELGVQQIDAVREWGTGFGASAFAIVAKLVAEFDPGECHAQ